MPSFSGPPATASALAPPIERRVKAYRTTSWCHAPYLGRSEPLAGGVADRAAAGCRPARARVAQPADPPGRPGPANQAGQYLAEQHARRLALLIGQHRQGARENLGPGGPDPL